MFNSANYVAVLPSVETLKKLYGRNLQKLMKRSGVNGRGLAQALGVTPGIVSRWVNGQIFPDTTVIDKMREKFGWKLREILGEEEISQDDVITDADAIRKLADVCGFERPRLKRKTSVSV